MFIYSLWRRNDYGQRPDFVVEEKYYGYGKQISGIKQDGGSNPDDASPWRSRILDGGSYGIGGSD